MEESLLPAAQIILALIPIVGISFAAVLVFFMLLWKHRENKLRIIKGKLDEQKSFNLKAFSLLSGLCLVGVGIVLTVMFFVLEHLSWALLGGLIPLVVGLAFLIFYWVNPDFRIFINEKHTSGEE